MNSSLTCDSAPANMSANLSCAQPPMGRPFTLFYTYAFGSAIYMITVAFLTVPANSALLLVFFVDPFKTFRGSPSTYFLVGLAIADLIMGLIQEPLYSTVFILLYIEHPKRIEISIPMLDTARFISGIAITASLLIILAFTVTQYIVISSPLKHARHITNKKVIFTVSLIFVYSTLFWTIHYLVAKDSVANLDIVDKIDAFLHLILVPVLNIIFFVLLHMAFKRKMKQADSIQSESSRQQQEERDKRVRIERKFITVNFMLMAILILCLQPAAIFWWLRLVWLSGDATNELGITILMIDNMIYLKCLLDPIVYAWRLPKYRQALKKILHCPNLTLKRRSKYQESVRTTMSKSTETVVTLSMRELPA